MSLGNVNQADLDHSFMEVALAVAARGLGIVWPNPAVGCVLVAAGRKGAGFKIVGRGWTQPGGRPHAETEALARAGKAAKGTTAYLTLEPCAHHGQTPPCAEALAGAGVARAVVAMLDPDPRVAGKGVAILEAAGIAVDLGTCEPEARELNAGYLRRVNDGRPLVTLKVATTLDGRIATGDGSSKWITGPAARARGHLMRARHDAILVGAQTVAADNPSLTCRLPGLEDRSPVRVVADGRLRTAPESTLARTARDVPTWIITLKGAAGSARKRLEALGVEIIEVDADGAGYPDMGAALEALAARGITRLMVEGGGKLAASLLSARLVDHLAWFRSSRVIGGDGVSVIAALGIAEPGKSPRFRRLGVRSLGDDVLETYVAES